MVGTFRVKIEGLYIDGVAYKAGEILSPAHSSSVPEYFVACDYVEAAKPGTKAQPRTSRKQATSSK